VTLLAEQAGRADALLFGLGALALLLALTSLLIRRARQSRERDPNALSRRRTWLLRLLTVRGRRRRAADGLRRSIVARRASPSLVAGYPMSPGRTEIAPVDLATVAAALLAVAGTEVVLALGYVLVGQIAAAVLVPLLLIGPRRGDASSRHRRERTASALRALALVPLARVIAIALPLPDFSAAAGGLIVAVLVAIAAIRLAPRIGVATASLFAYPQLLSPWAPLAGAVLGFAAWFSGAPALAHDGDAPRALVVAAAAACMLAVAEELVFRGVVQTALQRAAGRVGVLAASVVFPLLYLGFESVPLVLTMAIAGLLFADVVMRTGSMGAAITGHVLLGAGASVVWPLVLGSPSRFDVPEPALDAVLGAGVVLATLFLLRGRGAGLVVRRRKPKPVVEAEVTGEPAGALARILRIRNDRLIQNSAALMLTSTATSGLGFIFWTIAANRYPASEVGRASAFMAGANLLAILAQLNLSAVLIRFLPRSGHRTRELVQRSYTVTVCLALVLALAFQVLHLGHDYLGGSPALQGLFVAAVVLILVSALQDSLLTGMRQAPAVLLINLVFAAVRIVLLLVLVFVTLPAGAIVIAWLTPAALGAAAVGVYVFRVAIPRHATASDGDAALPPRRRLFSFIAAEYAKSILTTAAGLTLPLIIAASLGLAEAAYFMFPWLISTALGMLLFSVSTSFVVEAGFEGERAGRIFKRAMWLGLIAVVGGTIVQVVGAPFVLGIMGPDYAREGTDLMRLLGLALPFTAISAIYITFAWMEQRMWRLVSLEAINAVTLLGSAPFLLAEFGLTGIGWAYLGSQMIMGLGSIIPVARRLRSRANHAVAWQNAHLPAQPDRLPAGV
jgi:O-antigen/teichoic acid export membrane protein/membrane protease YdiL (CAAX protease family)